MNSTSRTLSGLVILLLLCAIVFKTSKSQPTIVNLKIPHKGAKPIAGLTWDYSFERTGFKSFTIHHSTDKAIVEIAHAELNPDWTIIGLQLTIEQSDRKLSNGQHYSRLHLAILVRDRPPVVLVDDYDFSMYLINDLQFYDSNSYSFQFYSGISEGLKVTLTGMFE